MGQSELERPIVDEALQPLLHPIDPLHGVEALEAGVLHWVCDIWQRVKGQEFRRLREFSTSIVQVGFEVNLLSFQLLFSPLPKVLIVVRMKDVDDEVEVEVEL